MRSALFAVLAASAILLGGSPAQAEEPKEWAVLLYLQAWPDLVAHARGNLRAIECAPGAASDASHEVIAQLDLGGLSGPRRYRLLPAKSPCTVWAPPAIESKVIGQLNPADTSSEEERLRDYLSWAIAKYPARHHLVIVWGHGRGYADASAGESAKAGGVARRADGSFLDGPGLRRALEAAAKAKGGPIDVYASDACLMQSIEVVAELASVARFVAGSPQIQSFQGLPYGALLGALGGLGKDDPAAKLAAALPVLARRSFAPGGELAGRDPGAAAHVAWSAVDAKVVADKLVPALHALGAALEAFVAEDQTRRFAIRSALSRAPAYAGDARDLGVLFRLLEQVRRRELNAYADAAEALGPALDAAAAALDATVVSRALGSQYSDPAWSGGSGAAAERALSAWIPASPADHAARRAEFERSAFFRSAGARWGPWLSKVFEAEHP